MNHNCSICCCVVPSYTKKTANGKLKVNLCCWSTYESSDKSTTATMWGCCYATSKVKGKYINMYHEFCCCCGNGCTGNVCDCNDCMICYTTCYFDNERTPFCFPQYSMWCISCNKTQNETVESNPTIKQKLKENENLLITKGWDIRLFWCIPCIKTYTVIQDDIYESIINDTKIQQQLQQSKNYDDNIIPVINDYATFPEKQNMEK